ncbi:MAG TPA: hypothetical protein VGK45_18880 [Thermoanaerobaculia bacterium]
MAPVVGEESGLGGAGFESPRDFEVERLAVPAEQGVVGGVLDQGVLEGVLRAPAGAAAVDEPGLDQPVQPFLDLFFRQVGDVLQAGEGERPAEHGRDLGHLLARAGAVEPGRQRGHERRRDLLRLAGPGAFEERLGHLLGEQGDAVGQREELAADAVRQDSPVEDAVDQALRFAVRQPAQAELGETAPVAPGHLEIGTERRDEEHGDRTE